jgi:hypothetical protein
MAHRTRFTALGLWLLAVAAFAQAPQSPPAANVSAEKGVRLDIPDAGQEDRTPEEGWCGESAIQAALSYYGVYASQKAINQAGKPSTPDLQDDDIPIALKGMDLEFKRWDGKGLQPFLTWIRGELAAGHPVLLGVKIYPTEHPDWDLDHFVLAVGCTKNALTLDTTWEYQETRSIELLSSEKFGLSFTNRHNTYFGYSITGMKLRAKQATTPVRINIKRDGDAQVELHVTTDNLERGKRYQILKYAGLDAAKRPDARPELLRSFTADGPKAEFVEKIGLDDARVYRCLPSAE